MTLRDTASLTDKEREDIASAQPAPTTPSSDGLAERAVQLVKRGLAKLCFDFGH